MLLNTILLALRSIRRNLLRSFLTMLGIVIGVGAVIAMVTLGNGATQAVHDQIASLGSNLLMVRTGQRMGQGGSGAPAFKEADAEAIALQIGGIRAVAAEARSGATVVANGRNWTTTVTGGSAEWIAAANWTLSAGRQFDDGEQRAGGAVCALGATVARSLFGRRDPLGERLRIKQFSCVIVALLAPKGQGAMGNDQDDVVLLPLHTLQRRVTGNQRVNTLLISMQEGSDATALQARLRLLLRERRKLGAAEEDNFNILDTRQLAETMSGATRVMTTLLAAVAAVSLLVGGIGIMNIMLVSVTERTREIGLRLAIGAQERDVLLQFLIEAMVLAALGGLAGVLLAALATVLMAHALQLPYLFNPGVNLLSFLFSAGIGVVFGYVPARRAARMDPIEALRHE
ncbi:ABC transporter permease [Duganella sp. BJB488]|uniref:ABC transporter permease n=1 Tax=unclassified Duganella TaxID=2636909 RepID=UPI000E35023F|nr:MULTISPECIES: ABC transporter permease [unclassified Duganella]NVD74725.1 ABC transporter permease [Duganella sp. BJB1802]RFP21631.1 ABC transporter permease [Duganella sp. BJB489]RFP23424.1 ABC transporter permease [Duganella sp. BJB488]RFP38590.1 ABC transporter permease [Duganella sp. BJB480]